MTMAVTFRNSATTGQNQNTAVHYLLAVLRSFCYRRRAARYLHVPCVLYQGATYGHTLPSRADVINQRFNSGIFMTNELYWLTLTLGLTALMAFPYVLNRMAVRGLMGAMSNPSDQDKPLSDWAQRAQRAHANAVENLVLFAPAVLAIQATGHSNALTATACALYFWSRLLHYVVYTAGIPVVRTLCFFGGWAGIIMLVAHLLNLL
jgi:uncharacterized MAPEG superfamily protein